MRVGFGYDVHRLVEGRPLLLGGVEIRHHRGLLGHSDADVLLHAIMDALLGAAGLGDIGRHFPPEDPAYKGISSLLLLEKTAALVRAKGLRLVNVDSTIVCQAPRLGPHIPAMVEVTARALNCSPGCVNIKATTEEGLGFTGSGEAISAHAVALVTKEGEKP